MEFFRKNLSVLLFVIVFFLLSPNLVVRAQQVDSQRQTLITQIQQQIIQLQQQLALILNQQQVILGVPILLKIPKININATIEDVGLTFQGAMDVPKGPTDVAWFKLGPRPGEIGSAVISGHYGRWKNGQGSVFDDLSKLNKGDTIYVEDDKGAITTFVVRESRTYDPKSDASNVFNSSDGKVHLNLITCKGVWNKANKTYSERLVVFTDKE